MDKITDEQIEKIGLVLNDNKRPLKERFRALFTLKNIGGKVSIFWINKCFNDESVLLKHELAYCLGQMQDVSAVPILISVLKNHSQEPMVRHEAAEALGAIGSVECESVLKEFSNDDTVEVAETCQLALGRIHWLNNKSSTGDVKSNSFYTIDPAPPSTENDISLLRKTLLDDNANLFDRYRAMFALRDLNNNESVSALAQGLKVGGALFRHEIAFVLGQLQNDTCVDSLIEALEDKSQNEMVRHECAEALGAIATSTCKATLNKHLHDQKAVVRESCEVALDMSEYETSPEFQYADTFLKVST